MFFSSSKVLFASLVSLVAVNGVTAATFSTNIKIGALTESQVLAIAPNSADCSKASFPDECTNATVATEQLNIAFKAYKVWSLGPKAALASLIAFESGDFVYNFNHFPGRPGQGTKAMLMFKWIYKFALWSGFNEEVSDIVGKPAESVTEAETATFSNDTMNAIRALVLPVNLTFKAAPWYLVKQCKREHYEGLITDGYEGFKNYIELCIEAGDITEDRTAKWCTAVSALKPTDMDMPTQCTTTSSTSAAPASTTVAASSSVVASPTVTASPSGY
ncbi:hypothetical protein DFP73DRAFT_569564 [Morchella snyderi]|nr:hypothetical protein DFP73DRAFT_569564 [Morchella snyderi]